MPIDIQNKVFDLLCIGTESECEYTKLPTGAGNRIYIRAQRKSAVPESGGPATLGRIDASDKKLKSIVVVYGPDAAENKTFCAIAEHIVAKHNELVPEILYKSANQHWYIVSDCGDTNLLELILKTQENTETEACQKLLFKAVDSLVQFQTLCQDWDFSQSYPMQSFDGNEITNYFRKFEHRLLLNLGVNFSELELETVLSGLIDTVRHIPAHLCGPIHRDYQARNILVQPDYTLRIIDFQALRHGPLIYDVLSLLGQSSVQYGPELQNRVIDYFTQSSGLSTQELYGHIPVIRLIRNLQSLGSYGVAGIENGQEYFLNAIPKTLEKALIQCAENEHSGLYMSPLIRALEQSLHQFKLRYTVH